MVKSLVLNLLEFYINTTPRLPFRNFVCRRYVRLCQRWKIPFMIIDECSEEEDAYEHFSHWR